MLFTWIFVLVCFQLFFIFLVESNQKTSFQEIPKLNEDLVQNQKQLEQIETGELGLSKIWINITEINKQVRGNQSLVFKKIKYSIQFFLMEANFI